MTTNKTATFIKKLDGTQGPSYVGGDVRLYRLSQQIPFWDYGPNITSTLPAGETTVVAVVVHGNDFDPETAVFPADAEGNENVDDRAFCLITRGWLSHQKALEMLGFEVRGGTEEVDPDQILNMAIDAAQNATRNVDFADLNMPAELEAILGSELIVDEDETETGPNTGTED